MNHDLSRAPTSAPPQTIDPARMIAAERLLPAVIMPPSGSAARRPVGRGPAPSNFEQEENRELERRVRNFLDQRSIPSLRRLTVEAAGNSVVLRGTVRTYYEKQLAINCCQRVAGVLDVVDAIEVSGVGSSTP
jgi:hypothetical protein